MNKNQILKAAGEYADKYEKENGFTTHPKTASFHGYIAGYDDAKLATDGREDENNNLRIQLDWQRGETTALQSSLKEKEKECEMATQKAFFYSQSNQDKDRLIEELKAENERLKGLIEKYEPDIEKYLELLRSVQNKRMS